jgi:ABC-type dipeptide/oligopeptide/nickel transport system permease component
MWSFILKRLVQGVITVWFIATATFFAMHNVPGDPLLNDRAMTPAIRANVEAKYGLDKPISEQYVIYLGNLMRGDFGISFTQENREVNDIIREHFPVSARSAFLPFFSPLRVGFYGVRLPRSIAIACPITSSCSSSFLAFRCRASSSLR